jgi:hypothetical protein
MEIMILSTEIMDATDGSWGMYLDNGWNTTIPKLIDNAILLLAGKSVKVG